MDPKRKTELEAEKEAERTRYFAARNRAIERIVFGKSFFNEVLNAFSEGLHYADGSPTDIFTMDNLPIHKILSETNYAFAFICGVLCKLEAVKGQHYEASWQKRGDPGIVANVHRKVDRIDALLGGDSEAGETLTQTNGDAAVYLIKWIALRAEIRPDEFLEWAKEIRKLKPSSQRRKHGLEEREKKANDDY